MEEYVRKELEDICNNILSDTQGTDVEQQLASVQELYEKLLVLNYLSSRKTKVAPAAPAPAPTPRPEPEPTPQPVVEKPAPQPIPQPEVKPEEPKPAPTPTLVSKKPAPVEHINESSVIEEELTDDKTPEQQMEEVLLKASQPASTSKNSSINERYGSGAIKLGLNDRLAFTNHLFAGQQEDLNRVISQINTFESLQEAEDFIEQMVKPDYDWSQKEEFEMRFMERVKQRFGE